MDEGPKAWEMEVEHSRTTVQLVAHSAKNVQLDN